MKGEHSLKRLPGNFEKMCFESGEDCRFIPTVECSDGLNLDYW